MDAKKRQPGTTNNDGQGLLLSHLAAGLLVSLAVLIVGALALALVQLSNPGFTPTRTVFLLVNYSAVVIGSLVAARRAQRHGFAVGAGIGGAYALIALLLTQVWLSGAVASGGLIGAFGWLGLAQAFAGTVVFGAFAGMIGVNLG